MMVAILCLILVAVYVMKKLLDNQKYADFYKIKGPKLLPLIGNAHLFGFKPNLKDIFQLQLKLAQEYNDFYRLTLGTEKVIALGRPEHLEIILGSMRHTKKSQNYNMFINWLGNGLVNSYGVYWQKHRKIISPTFQFMCLQGYATFMAKHLSTLVEILKTKTSETIDISHFVQLYALDTICDSAMRCNINAQANEQHDYVRALKSYLNIHMTRFYSVLLRSEFVFNQTALGRKQAKDVAYMKSFTSKVISSRKAERAANAHLAAAAQSEFEERSKKSFLDHLLDKQTNENLLTNDEIREEVATFTFAGHDSVTSSISFCLYKLAEEPSVQDMLVEESFSLMPVGKQIEVNCASIAALKYLDCVVKECMRIYTTVPFIERELEEDIILDGLRIPAGTTVQMMIYRMHNNPRYFPDPEKFDPGRFYPENCKNRHPYTYIPFSAGPRNCIAYKYGQLMTKATIINILRNFKVLKVEDPKYIPELYNGVLLESLNGVHIILEERP